MNWKLAIVGIFVVGCSHTQSSSQTPKDLPPDFLLNKETKQITFNGESLNPRFSPDGNKMVYASRDRSTHKGWQIYEYDFNKNKERRVTFSDGDAFDPVYMDNGSLLYASTTDEIKESPFQIKTEQPSDIYTSDLYGSDIQRLIQNPGYDARPNSIWTNKSQQLVFSSLRNKMWAVYQYDFKKKATHVLAGRQGFVKKFPHVNQRLEKMVWVDENTKAQTKTLMLYNFKTKKTESLVTDFVELENPFLTELPTPRVYFNVKRAADEYHHLEVYDIEKKCTQVVFKANGSLESPVPHNQGTHIVFSRSFQKHKLLYSLPLPKDLGPCLEKPAQDKVTP